MNAPKHDPEFEELLRLEPLVQKLDELGPKPLLMEHFMFAAVFFAGWLPLLWMIFGPYVRGWFS